MNVSRSTPHGKAQSNAMSDDPFAPSEARNKIEQEERLRRIAIGNKKLEALYEVIGAHSVHFINRGIAIDWGDPAPHWVRKKDTSATGLFLYTQRTVPTAYL
jgi:hypothetical protein